MQTVSLTTRNRNRVIDYGLNVKYIKNSLVIDSPEMAMIRECARTAMAFARAGASAIAIADLHGVSGDLAMKLKLVAAQAGRLEPVVLGCTVDIARQDGVQAMHDTVSQGFEGRLDIVVNNAAHMEPYKPSLDSDPDVYWRTWEVDVHGLFNMGAEKTRP